MIRVLYILFLFVLDDSARFRFLACFLARAFLSLCHICYLFLCLSLTTYISLTFSFCFSLLLSPSFSFNPDFSFKLLSLSFSVDCARSCCFSSLSNSICMPSSLTVPLISTLALVSVCSHLYYNKSTITIFPSICFSFTSGFVSLPSIIFFTTFPSLPPAAYILIGITFFISNTQPLAL